MAQTLPFVIRNTSPFPDSDLYVAIVGEDLSTPSNHIWVDCRTSAVNPMSPSYNTVQGPVYGGNQGPGGNGKYANCFTRLSDIPNKTVNLPKIQGCRIFISVGQQLYFYFFGYSGAPSGYSSPSATNSTDPNKGIRYELIECTNGTNGFFGNTTRVDAYQYPMGMELYGTNYYRRVGDLKTHEQIVAAYKAFAPTEFQACLDNTTGVISAPSKIQAFADGSIGGMPVGPYVNYLKSYIDQIWTKYANEDLYFDSKEAGTWKGRVINEQLVLTGESGVFAGKRGIISRRPTTHEVLEGKGVLAQVVQDATYDKLVQAQMCAAINRHAVNVTTPNVGLQNWGNAPSYYSTGPCNYYAKFWHQAGINVDQLAYGFAYDDVFDQSSTLNTPGATKVVAVFGGFASGTTNVAPTVAITSPGNNASFNVGSSITITANATDSDGSISKVEFYNGATLLGTSTSSPYTFVWNNASTGSYSITAKATDNLGAVTTSGAITITVNPVTTVLSPYGGTPWNIPGKIEAENYDLGGSNLAYYDASGTNEGGAYRTDAVDIEGTTDAGGGYDVGWTSGGEWLKYTVNVTTTGKYDLKFRVASPNSGKTLRLEMNGVNVSGTVTVPNTGGWQNWQTVTIPGVALSAGKQILTVYFITDGLNLNNVDIAWSGVNNQSPTVAITAPSNNSSFNAGSSITFTANASDADGSIAKVEFYSNGSLLGTSTASPYKYAWNNVSAGTYSVTAKATDNAGASTTSAAINVTVKTITSGLSPYGGTPWNIPGRIEAENYDLGGSNVAFNDVTASNEGGAYRTDAVDIEGTADVGGGYNVGWTNPGEWLKYTVNVNSTGKYDLKLRVASPNDGKTLRLEVNGINVSGTVTAPNTGGWQNWQTVTIPGISLTAGKQVVTIYWITEGINVNYVEWVVSPINNSSPSVTLTSPGNNSTFNAASNITISANASDSDGSISKVEFYQGSTKLGEATTAPYTFVWNNVASGSYTIMAKAYDNLGASATSNTSGISVNSNTTCTGGVSNGDYTYEVVGTSSSSTIKFIPGAPIAGCNMVILYYQVNNGGYMGIYMDPSGSNFIKSIAVSAGSTVKMYFTYKVGTTGAERNSSATPHTFVAGNCSGTLKEAAVPAMAESPVVYTYPNPVMDILNLALNASSAQETEVVIADQYLNTVYKTTISLIGGANSVTLDVASVDSGIYFMSFIVDGQKVVQRIMISK